MAFRGAPPLGKSLRGATRPAARLRLRQEPQSRIKQDAFPRRVLPPRCRGYQLQADASVPRSARLAPSSNEGPESPAACHQPRHVSTPGPASSVLSPPEHKARWPDLNARGRAYRSPLRDAQTERRSSISATRPAREHHPRTARSPARSTEGRVRLASDWEQAPGGVGAPSTTSTVASGWRQARARSVLSCDVRLKAGLRPAEVSKVRDRPARAARQLAFCPKAGTQLDPDLVRSSTPCREPAAALAGDANAAVAGSPHRRVCAQAQGRRPVWPPYGPLSRDRRSDRSGKPVCTDEPPIRSGHCPALTDQCPGPEPPHPSPREGAWDPLHSRCFRLVSHRPSERSFRSVELFR